METNNTKEFIIYSKRVAYELRKLGFYIIRTEPNMFHPEFDTWIFVDSANLRAALTKITK